MKILRNISDNVARRYADAIEGKESPKGSAEYANEVFRYLEMHAGYSGGSTPSRKGGYIVISGGPTVDATVQVNALKYVGMKITKETAHRKEFEHSTNPYVKAVMLLKPKKPFYQGDIVFGNLK